jgi:hypothetical protein
MNYQIHDEPLDFTAESSLAQGSHAATPGWILKMIRPYPAVSRL